MNKLDEIKRLIYSKDLKPGTRILMLVSGDLWLKMLEISESGGFVQTLHNQGTWDLENGIRCLVYSVNGIGNGVKLGIEIQGN